MGGALHLRLLLGLICLCAAAKPILYDTLDPDVFWHLRVAEQLRAEEIGPLVDHLAAASDKTPWTPYSWLAELGMLRIWEWGGFRAALLVQALASAAFVGLIACSTFVWGRRPDAAAPTMMAHLFPTVLAAFVSLPYLSFRPATLALVLLAAVFLLISMDRARPTRLVYVAVPLTVLLANVHLYAFLVPAWFGCLALIVCRAADYHPGLRCRYGVLAVLSAAAACATPMLPGVLRTLLHYQFNDPLVASPVIAEMQPFWRGPMGQVSAVLVMLGLGVVVLHRRALTLADWGLLVLSTALLLMKGRYAPLFAITVAPILARSLSDTRLRTHDSTLRTRLLSPVVSVLLIALSVRLFIAFPSSSTALDQWLNRHGPDAPGYPTEAATWLERHVRPRHGTIVNEFTWGGYLGWRLSPRFTPLMDGRTQCFSQGFWRETYLSDRPKVSLEGDVAVLPRGKSLFRGELKTSGWKKVFGDEWAEVWVPPTQGDALKTLTPTLSRVQERE